MNEQLLRCEDCGWQGDAEESKHYVGVPEKWGIDVVREDRCPKCDSINLVPIDRDKVPV